MLLHNGLRGFVGLVQRVCNGGVGLLFAPLISGVVLMAALKVPHREMQTPPVDVQVPARRAQV